MKLDLGVKALISSTDLAHRLRMAAYYVEPLDQTPASIDVWRVCDGAYFTQASEANRLMTEEE